jgi:hypothetical protein
MDITGAHQFLGYAALLVTLVLLVVASWSAVAARHSAGPRDHRFAVDRVILGVLAVLAVDGAIGLVVMATAARPSDPLHLLYGPAALVTAPMGYWLARREGLARAPGSVRRDIWVAVAAVVLLGIEYRLFVTG